MLEKALLIAMVSAAVILGASAISSAMESVSVVVGALDRIECPKSQPNCKEK